MAPINKEKVTKDKVKSENESSSEYDSAEDESQENGNLSDEGDGEITYNTLKPYDPSQEEIRKLSRMNIQLRHTPLLQHEIEKTAGTRSLTKTDKKLFEQYSPLRTGTFSSDEDRLIRRNWRIFCKLHDWEINNPKPFLLMKYNEELYLMTLKNRKKFVQFLADGLPDRSLYSVYQRFKVMFEPHKVSRYKPHEDRVIINYIKNYDQDKRDTKFADLAKMLKRTRASVWRRYQKLQKSNKYKS